MYPGRALALDTMLSWVSQVERQELPPARVLLAQAVARRRLQPGFATLPLSDADRRVVGRRVGFFQDWLAHDTPGDPWWEPVDFRPAVPRTPPATLLAGWYDIFLPEQLADFVALRAAGRPARLTVGPWVHTSPGAVATGLRDALAWFDRYAGSDRSPGPPVAPAAAARPGPGTGTGTDVRLFVMGTRRWVDVPDWPPPATVQRWHLHPGGRLDPTPAGASPPDRFRYDPADPTPAAGGAALDPRTAGRRDQRRREVRGDVLVYTSEVLDGGVTVVGPLTADLWFRSSLAHTDVFVRLCVVSARGRSRNVSDGILRLGADHPTGDEGVRHVRIDMWPTAITFRRGERIRLQVSSGAHPLYARNPGSGEPLATARTLRVADQEVFHDPDRPSALELPVSTLLGG